MKGNSFMTRFFTLVCLVLGMGQAFAAWDGISKDEPTKEGDTYIIDTESKLAWYAENYTKGNAKLTADLDLNGKLWTPIAAGIGNKSYSKVFDGNGHIIKNLYVNGSELAAIDMQYAQNLGLVAVLGGGTVKNLTLENVDIQASTNAGDILHGKTDQQISVGAFVGWMNESENNLVDACMVTGTIKTTGNGQGVGGIVGNAKMGTISNCLSFVEIQASGKNAYVGGIIGLIKVHVNVFYCVYVGPGVKTGKDGAVGAIAGYVSNPGTLVTKNAFFEYDENEKIDGIGKVDEGCDVTDGTKRVDFSNTDNTVVSLNDEENETKPWSVGETTLLLNGYGPDGYKIVFDADGGTFADGATFKNKVLHAGMVIVADEVGRPTREGSTFKGWAFTKGSESPATDLGTVTVSDTLFAVWAPVYEIIFDVSIPGGEHIEKVIRVTKGDVITVDGLGDLPTKYCSAYVSGNEGECQTWSYFTGWANTNVSSTKVVDLSTVVAEEGLKLNAVWTDVETYTVTFNANKHGQTTVTYVRLESGNTVAKPENPVADEGYEFVNWYTEELCTNEFDFTTKINHSFVLYAKWNLKKFNISYVLNGAKDKGNNPESYTIESNTIVLADPTAAEGKNFEGWFYDAGFTQKATQIIQGSSGDKTLYAKWSNKTYKITYLADNESYGSVSDQIKEYGTSLTLASKGYFQRFGFDQVGWATSYNGKKVYDFGASYTANAPIVLYPAWDKVSFTITYAAGSNATGSVSSQKKYYDEGLMLAKAGGFTRDGYSQDGWATQDGGDKVYGLGATYTDNQNITLYPHWVAGQINVTYYGPVAIYKYPGSTGKKIAVINGEYTGSEELKIPNDIDVDSVVLERKFNVGIMSTIMLPFAIDTSKFKGGKIYKFYTIGESNKTWTVKIRRIYTPKVQANIPYFVMPTETDLNFIGPVTLNTEVEPQTPEPLETYNKWEYRGVYRYKVFGDTPADLGYVYGFAGEERNNKRVGEFVKAGAEAYIHPLRGYLINNNRALKKAQNGSLGGFGSGISREIHVEIVDENDNVVDSGTFDTVTGEIRLNGWFDVKGRRLKAKPTARGNYYHNGKHVIVK